MIRLFIIDSHPVVAQGLRSMFRPSRDNIKIIDSATNLVMALLGINHTQPDIILVDPWLHNGDPFEIITTLKVTYPNFPIVIYTHEDSVIWKKRMYQAGVYAYINKTAEKSELKLMLDKVSHLEYVFSGAMQSAPFVFESNNHAGNYRFTLNQKNILKLIVSGFSLKQIADKKGVTLSSIAKTNKKIREVLKAKNNAELTRIIFQKNLLETF